MVKCEIVAEENDSAGAQGHSRNEIGFFGPDENIAMLCKTEVHELYSKLVISYYGESTQFDNKQYQQLAMEDQASTELQELLQQFNKIDKRKQGNIRLQDAIKLLREKTTVKVFNDDLLERVIFNNDKMVTFDQFLALLYETELDSGVHNNLVNYKMVEFLKLLDEYRKKCEEASMYIEAEKAHQKTLEIRDKQMRRHKQKLMMQQKSKVLSVNSLQQNKLLEFNGAWNQYMDKYEDAALGSIEKLKAKHLREMEMQEQRIRNYYQNYLKPSKRVIDLRAKQKLLVKQKQYMEAERLKNYVEKLEQKEKEEKNLEINERIKKRKQTLQKHQEAALMAHLKRLQKDRNDQVKKRQLDSEKMFIKLRNIQNDIVQKQSIEIKQTLENLRETMCLTSGQLFQSKAKRVRSSDKILQSIQKQVPRVAQQSMEKEKRKTSFKIRVNSFHGASKLDSSMYNP